MLKARDGGEEVGKINKHWKLSKFLTANKLKDEDESFDRELKFQEITTNVTDHRLRRELGEKFRFERHSQYYLFACIIILLYF